MSQNIPEETIPIQSEDLHYQVARIYGDLGEKESMRKILDQLILDLMEEFSTELNMQIPYIKS